MARIAPSYCADSELSPYLGDVEPPRDVTLKDWADMAADEMDSLLGQYYTLPIELSEANPTQRADKLLLKKINAMLAAGRLITSMAVGGEGSTVHAYGNQLISDASKELARIAAGRTKLEGAELLPDESKKQSGPMIANRDRHSFVDCFYHSEGTAHLPMGSL